MGFFSRRRNRIIEEEIVNALLYAEGYHDTSIYWGAFEKFAQEHGGKTDRYEDGGQDTGFEMVTNGIEVKVMAVRDRYDDTASIKVQTLADFEKEVDKFAADIAIKARGRIPKDEKIEDDNPYKMFSGENKGEFKDGYYTTWYDNGQVKRITNYKPGTYMKEGKHSVWYEDGQLHLEEFYKEEDKNFWQEPEEDNFNYYKWTEWNKDGQILSKSYHRDGEVEAYKFCSWYESGQLQSKTIVDNKKEGKPSKFTEWYESGQMKEIHHRSSGTYDEGEDCTEWYENGQIKLEIKINKLTSKNTTWYENGQMKESQYTSPSRWEVGKWTEWYSNGQMKSISNYSYGTKVGKWTQWHKNGQEKSVRHYKAYMDQDLFEGIDSEGNLKHQGIANRKDIKILTWTEWYSNGQMKSSCKYKNGIKNKNWFKWDKNGKLTHGRLDDLKYSPEIDFPF